MKKIIYIKAIIMTCFIIFCIVEQMPACAQSAANCPIGYAPTGIFDDFTFASPPSNSDFSGVYPWGVAKGADPTYSDFQAIVSRNTSNQKLEINLSEGQNEYPFFGINFGDAAGNGTGAPHTIDISADGTFSVEFENKASYSVSFWMSIRDINGNIVDTYAAAGSDPDFNGHAWMYTIGISVPSGQTKTLSGTFAGVTTETILLVPMNRI